MPLIRDLRGFAAASGRNYIGALGAQQNDEDVPDVRGVFDDENLQAFEPH
jgi:hypothetical protein